MKIDEAKLEWILIAAIGVILIFIFANFGNEPTRTEVVIDESAFDDYPLIAWKDTHEKWDGSEQNIVKIKYRVFNDDTFIQIVNNEGEVVHTQPFQRSPWDDGRFRDFTYIWKLYYTEDYGDDIPPGEYQIQVCYRYSRNVDMVLDITI
tara:strand:- start:1305 stop:1751 length:447 start_codon:yes stop_codon:yes gene_type:complete